MKKYILPTVLFLAAIGALVFALLYASMAQSYVPASDFYNKLSSIFGFSFYALFVFFIITFIRAFRKRKKQKSD